jgi:peroxiredoxin
MPKRNIRTRNNKFDPVVIVSAGVLLVSLAVVLLLLRARSGPVPQPASAQSGVAPAAVNMPEPELSLENVNGKIESLTDNREHVVLVNNWAVWCPPCKAELPTLEAYYEAHAAEGFIIIAIEAGDPKDTVSQFVRSDGLKFRVWLDPDNASLSAFKNTNLPNSYVIDRSGTVRYAWVGETDQAMLEKYITALLSQQ